MPLIAEDSTIFGLALPPAIQVFVLDDQWSVLNDNGEIYYLYDGTAALRMRFPITVGLSLSNIIGKTLLQPAPRLTRRIGCLLPNASGSTPGILIVISRSSLRASSGSLSFSPDPYDPDFTAP